MRPILVLAAILIAPGAMAATKCVTVEAKAKVLKVEPVVSSAIQVPSFSEICDSNGCVRTLDQIATITSVSRYNVTYQLDGKVGKGYVSPESGEPKVGTSIPVKKRLCVDPEALPPAPSQPKRIQM